jgi:hypothetical protein
MSKVVVDRVEYVQLLTRTWHTQTQTQTRPLYPVRFHRVRFHRVRFHRVLPVTVRQVPQSDTNTNTNTNTNTMEDTTTSNSNRITTIDTTTLPVVAVEGCRVWEEGHLSVQTARAQDT